MEEEESSTTSTSPVNLINNSLRGRQPSGGCCGNCTPDYNRQEGYLYTPPPKIPKTSFKVILTGDGAVGKTTIQKRMYGKPTYCTVTIGPEFVFIPFKIDQDNNVKLTLWDTQGQEKYSTFISRVYFRGTDIILLVFDVCKRSSFEHLSEWLRILNEEVTSPSFPTFPPVILIGNKIDKTVMETTSSTKRRNNRNYEQREVTTEEATNFAMENNCIYVELSAWTAENFDELNNHLVNTIKDIQQRYRQQYEQQQQQQQ